MRTTCPWAAIALAVLLPPAGARAFVPSAEAVPGRPLVLDPGVWELAGGAHLLVLGSDVPEPGLQDSLLIPLSAATAVHERWELGLAVDTRIRPDFRLSLTPRCRFAVDGNRILALGMALTLPLGYLTDRLGPEGLPLSFELPAVRLESSAAALRAGLLLSYHVREGPDARALAVDAAGVVCVAGPVFAVMHLGIPMVEHTRTRVGLGLGAGWQITRRIIGKLEAQTPELDTLNTWQVVIMISTGLETLQQSDDDWL